MSAGGTLSNYYVDAIMGHEAEDAYGARFAQGAHSTTSRPSGVGDSPDFSSCSFAPKSAVFSTSWSPVHPQSSAAVSGIYHPYMHQSHLAAAESRYVRSWIDPLSTSVSFSGFHPNSRHYGIKPETLPSSKRTECSSFEAQAPSIPDFTSASFSESKDKPAKAKEPFSSDISSNSELKEETQQQLDPSNPAANWIHARSTRKKRCPYTKYQTLELEKNSFLTCTSREIGVTRLLEF